MDTVKLQNNLEVICKLGGPITKVLVQEIEPFPMAIIVLTFEEGVVLRFQADINTVETFTVEED